MEKAGNGTGQPRGGPKLCHMLATCQEHAKICTVSYSYYNTVLSYLYETRETN